MCAFARCVCAWLALAAAAAAAAAQDANVTVVWRQLTYEDTHELLVNASVEYILPFAPSPEQRLWPVRLWIKAEGGDTARPLLVTARQSTGARTWQVPYRSGEAVLYELERTLCPADSIEQDSLHDADCGDPQEAPGQLSLHVGSSCAASTVVQLRAAFASNWRVAFESSVAVQALQGAPQVMYYSFPEEQQDVRLVVESQDDVCATIAVHNYTCPIPETLEDLERSTTVRMTVQRSGGMQLSRERYPRGFYVVALVRDADDACVPPAAERDDWLWDAAVLAARPAPAHQDLPRSKTFTIRTQAALSRGQYVVGAVATLALFMVFYVCAGAVILAQRLPRWRRLVGPRAVLARKPNDGTRSEIESAMSARPTRQRRDSTATFDSSDNSDTDEEEGDTATAATETAAGVADTINNVTAITNGDSNNPDNTRNANATVSTSDVSNFPASHGGAAAADSDPVRQVVEQQDTSNGNGIFVTNSTNDEARAQSWRPFGLPARLHVAALARRRARVLQSRSDRYLYTLYTVGLFYALPVLQFVAAFQIVLNVSGSLDVCYYNFLCAHPAGALADFNHVLSNAGYLLLGALFLLQVRRRRLRRKRKPRDEEYGIPAHYGLLSSLGAAMMMVALLSAAYHVCPNGLNFQFDTAFMYVLAVLSMVKIYQSRHPDINARAHATFGVLAVLIALVVWGVLGGGPLFWSVFTVLHVFTFLLLSLRIYYVGQFRLEKESLQRAARAARELRVLRPLYSARLVMLLIANAANWGLALYGLFTQSADFAGHLLSVLLCNTLMHMTFYLTMKLLHGERPRWYSWLQLGAAAAAWAPALYFFTSGSTDWSTSPAQSRHLNHECRVLQFYDSHDLWHMLSAVALYFSFNALLTWDDGLAAVKRTEIAVF